MCDDDFDYTDYLYGWRGVNPSDTVADPTVPRYGAKQGHALGTVCRKCGEFFEYVQTVDVDNKFTCCGCKLWEDVT